ncbi:MAG: WbqC family protein [Bacteroidota bacterium]|nr:WbqC family protein [Bacteroidota bacterium]
MANAYLSTAYFPPIQYFCKLLEYDTIIIEAQEHYQKQSYRNRCRISGPNSIQSLSIPVERGRSREIPIRDIKIDYSMPWQINHLRSIKTAYHSAPYFEHYMDDLEPLFQAKVNFLFDFNLKILETINQMLEINAKVIISETYEKTPTIDDFRDSIHPKTRMHKKDSHFQPKEYMQVFIEKHGFIANLSILDLLMNEGPLSITTIKDSIIS